jgi:hypothetical protein
MMKWWAVLDYHLAEWLSHLRVPSHLWQLDWLRPEDLASMQEASGC